MFDFADTTIENSRTFYAFEEAEVLRQKFANDNSIIEVTDLGSGSQVSKSNRRMVSSIYKSAVSGNQKAELLFRIAMWTQPNQILELGTSLGISSFYFHKAAQKAEITTIEGCPNIYKLANSHLKSLPKITHINNDFDSFLKGDSNHYDLIYIDGNHDYEPTMRYANLLRKSMTSKSVIIFDDIYWSKNMTRAWGEIKKKRIFDATIDLYQFGLGILDPFLQDKRDWVLIQKKLKPWKLGFWS